MRRFAVGLATGLGIGLSLACAGAPGAAGQMGPQAAYELTYISYDNRRVNIQDFDTAPVKIYQDFVVIEEIYEDDTKLVIPSHVIHYMTVK